MPPPAPVTIGVYYDFASSLCYVAHRVMERLDPELAELGIELRWLPLDLTRLTAWRRGDAIYGERRRHVVEVSRDLGVPLEVPASWMDSRRAMAIALQLAGSPGERAWRERVWTAVFIDGDSLDQPGLVDRLLADLEGPRPHDRESGLEAETERAVAAGVHGVPTFMLGIWPVGGIQEESTMRTFLRRFAERSRQDEARLGVN